MDIHPAKAASHQVSRFDQRKDLVVFGQDRLRKRAEPREDLGAESEMPAGKLSDHERVALDFRVP